MIKKCCENCCVCEKAGDETHDIYKCLCSDDKPLFTPKEELVRKDERNKIITLLKSDLENYNGLAIEKADNNHCRVWIKYNEVRKYIKSTIELLEKN